MTEPQSQLSPKAEPMHTREPTDETTVPKHADERSSPKQAWRRFLDAGVLRELWTRRSKVARDALHWAESRILAKPTDGKARAQNDNE